MEKIAIVSASLARGGAERVTIHLSKYLKENDFDVYIVTGGMRDNEYELSAGVERISLNDSKKTSYWHSIKMLRKIIRDKKIDVVLIMGVPLCVYSIPGCLRTGVKIIVSERNDPLHFGGRKSTKLVSRFLMKFADGFVFQTKDAQNFYKGKLKTEGVVIPNPLILEGFPEPYEGEREKVIVTAGRLNPQKNQKLLIRAFAGISNEFPEYKLVIYGEGGLKNELEAAAAHCNVADKVLFPGNVTDLHERIKKAAIFVLTSDFEGMPNALIEAMALGLPCVSTDCPCGGPRELINHGENGLLVPVGDVDALQNSLKECLHYTEKAKMMGQKAVSIRDRLNIKTIGSTWVEYLNR